MKDSNHFTNNSNEEDLKASVHVVNKLEEPVFCIDLGTTNSAIAVVPSGKSPHVITLDNGKKTMPSCVQWKGKEFIVGDKAYKERYKKSTVYSIKTLMGQATTVSLEYAGRTKKMTPVEVSAEILKGLVAKAGTQFKNINKAVIAVPAYFSSEQVQATIDAGKLAGLDCVGIVREPTAAATGYGLSSSKKKEEVILVYDLGGGTFDVSLLRITNEGEEVASENLLDLYGIEQKTSVSYNVLNVSGDSHLGGDDIDKELLNIILDKIQVEKQISPSSFTTEYKEKLLLHLEQLKKSGIALYTTPIKTKLKDGKAVNFELTITPEDMVQSVMRVYNKTKKIIDKVLENVDISILSSITLVGGSTKSEVIKSALKRDFPNVIINDALNPDEAVAAGGAVYAKELVYGNKDIRVFEVIPHSIGVFTDSGIVQVISKNDTLPKRTETTFSTLRDDQKEIVIDIFEGESTVIEESRYLGSIKYTDFKPGKAGEVSVLVEMSVDTNGLLTCSTSVQGKRKKVELLNLLGRKGADPLLERKNKKAIRWKKYAESLKDESISRDLFETIEKYVSGEVDESIVVEKIRKISSETAK
jgi:molecular chaperone DnaK (HSP70)